MRRVGGSKQILGAMELGRGKLLQGDGDKVARCWGYHLNIFSDFKTVENDWSKWIIFISPQGLKFGWEERMFGTNAWQFFNMSQPTVSPNQPATECTVLVLLEVHCRQEIVLFDACLTPKRHPLHSLSFTQDTREYSIFLVSLDAFPVKKSGFSTKP